MTFILKDLDSVPVGGGWAQHFYKTTDTAATVDSSGYFNAASGRLKVGDFIFLNTETGGTMKGGLVMVNSNSGGVVDVGDMTAISATDTD
jgi:hypothetical protein